MAEESFLEEIVEDIEDVFKPKPGGMIDQHRKERARREAAQREQENINEGVEEYAYKAVKTAIVSPEIFNSYTLSVAPGATAMVLPLAPYRYRALITVITSAGSIILAKDSSAALGQNGFPYVNGLAPLELRTRAQVWVYNPGGAAVQIGVIAESYSPETCPK